MGNIKYLVLIKTVFFVLVCFNASVSSAQPLLDQPTIENSDLRSGEVLKYNAKIKGIPAGDQTLRVNGKKLLNGYEVYHVESISKAKKFFSLFYRFDNRSESFITSKNFHPLRYKKTTRDGGYSGSTAVYFDPINKVARILKNNQRTELRVPAGIQDELSIIYLLRTKEIEVGQRYEFSALIGTEALEASVSVLRIERLKTAIGTLRTIVVKTIPRGFTMWLTDDSTRVPVKIEASTKLGKLVFNLKEMH